MCTKLCVDGTANMCRIRIPFAANWNLSGFCVNTKGIECAECHVFASGSRKINIPRAWRKLFANHYAGYTLCTNVDKFGANLESCIAYTQVIRIRFVRDSICDSWFVNSQPPAVFPRTIKGHGLNLHWFVCDVFIHCSCILEDLFWKFLNSSRLINYQLIGFWLFAMIHRWVRKSWIRQNHEQCIESSSWRFAIRNLFSRMVHKFQIRASYTQCIASIMWFACVYRTLDEHVPYLQNWRGSCPFKKNY